MRPIEVVSNNRFPTPLPPSDGVVEGLYKDLDQNGIVLLPRLIPDEQLQSMQRAFESRLQRLRWNNFEGYEKTEPYRHMIEDVLLIDQGFLDLAFTRLSKRSSKLTSVKKPSSRKHEAGDHCRPKEIFTAGMATNGTTRRRIVRFPES